MTCRLLIFRNGGGQGGAGPCAGAWDGFAFSAARRWAAVERKRVRRQVQLERCPLGRVRGRRAARVAGQAYA